MDGGNEGTMCSAWSSCGPHMHSASLFVGCCWQLEMRCELFELIGVDSPPRTPSCWAKSMVRKQYPSSLAVCLSARVRFLSLSVMSWNTCVGRGGWVDVVLDGVNEACIIDAGLGPRAPATLQSHVGVQQQRGGSACTLAHVIVSHGAASSPQFDWEPREDTPSVGRSSRETPCAVCSP